MVPGTKNGMAHKLFFTIQGTSYLFKRVNYLKIVGKNIKMEILAKPIIGEQKVNRETDNDLVLKYLNGNEDAFYELVERYKDKIVNYIFKLINNREVSVELSQETFLRIYRYLPDYKFDYKFSTLIYKIASNLAIDYLRKEGKFLENDDVDFERFKVKYEINPEENLLKEELKEKLKREIMNLPLIYREPFILKEIEGLEISQIAKILSCKKGTVKSRLFRARAILKEKLSPYLGV